MQRTQDFFLGSRALVIGASGGIGGAVAAELSREGASVTGSARRSENIRKHFTERGIRGATLAMDLSSPKSIAATLKEIIAGEGAPDHVVIAAGHDVRAPFERHTADDIEASISVNFASLVAICATLYPAFLARGSGSIAYVGGFGDGSLAFPFYSVDVATRSAAAKFLESLNRELPKKKDLRKSAEGRAGSINFLYFGPTAVMTESEREYLDLWKKMGTPIVSPERVARELVAAIKRGKSSASMGGAMTKLGIAINALSPKLADTVFMNEYRTVMEPRFRPAKTGE